MEFNFMTDENIHAPIVEFLRRKGLDVYDVKEAGFSGQDDETLLALATKLERVIITHDSDFGKLTIAGEQPFHGIVYLKPGHINPDFTIQTLNVILESVSDIRSPFILVAKRVGEIVKIREKQY